MGHGVRRVEAERFAPGGDRALPVALLQQRVAEVGVRPGEIRVETDRLPVRGDGAVQVTLGDPRHAEVEVSDH
jgi:hypothetical protein